MELTPIEFQALADAETAGPTSGLKMMQRVYFAAPGDSKAEHDSEAIVALEDHGFLRLGGEGDVIAVITDAGREALEAYRQTLRSAF